MITPQKCSIRPYADTPINSFISSASRSKTMQSVAFIGLGHMGSGMAANLARSGARVAAYDLSVSALERARAAGCQVAASAAEAVRASDIVVTMLPAGQ